MPGSSLLLRSCMAAEIRRGTLERVPQTPQNFPERIIIAITQRSRPVPRQAPIEHYLPAHLQYRTGTAAGVPGAKPPAELTYGLPLPTGKGVGGIGAEKQAKGKVDRQPTGQAPAGVSLPPSHLQCRTGTAAGVPGAKPPAELTYSLPLPRRGRGLGAGGMGAGRMVKAG